MSFSILWIAGFIAAALFLINSTMFPRLLYIRKGKNRILKRKIALYLRKEMKWHATLGWFGLAFVWIHISVQWQSFTNLSLISKRSFGALAILLLAVVLWSGWLRSQKANGRRRSFHAWSSVLFTFVLLLHVFW